MSIEEINMSDFSSRLRECRKLKNLTQQQLASEIGLSCRTVQQYESGERTPTFDGLIKIARFFECSADYLLCLSDSTTPTNQKSVLSRRTDPDDGAVIFEYEKNGEKATLRFPRNATAGEIQEKINQFLPLPRGRGPTDERE